MLIIGNSKILRHWNVVPMPMWKFKVNLKIIVLINRLHSTAQTLIWDSRCQLVTIMYLFFIITSSHLGLLLSAEMFMKNGVKIFFRNWSHNFWLPRNCQILISSRWKSKKVHEELTCPWDKERNTRKLNPTSRRTYLMMIPKLKIANNKKLQCFSHIFLVPQFGQKRENSS